MSWLDLYLYLIVVEGLVMVGRWLELRQLVRPGSGAALCETTVVGSTLLDSPLLC